MLRPLITVAWIALIALFCWLMIGLTIPYLSFRADVDFLLTKQKIIHLRHWRYAFYCHILLSILSLIAGLTQFSDPVLKKHRRLHRLMGYIYSIDVICLAGPSGLILAFYANGNAISRSSFILLSLLWIYSTALAVYKILRKDSAAHQAWMIRSYALTLSAITLRLLALILPRFVHLDAHTEYALIAWLSWLLNLLIAELIIYSKKLSS